jgi:hypothetical protein
MRFSIILLASLISLTAAAQEPTSQPTPAGLCGNGSIDPGETCDDGSANSEYGPCLPGCTIKYVPPKAPKEVNNEPAKPSVRQAVDITDQPIYTTKDPDKAFHLAITCTLFCPVIGPIVGPSVGHIYAGEVGHAVATSSLRLLALGAAFLGTRVEDQGAKVGLLAFGLGTWQALTLYDLIDANNVVERVADKQRASLVLTPLPRGLAIGLSF